jgi:hypothetical protein
VAPHAESRRSTPEIVPKVNGDTLPVETLRLSGPELERLSRPTLPQRIMCNSIVDVDDPQHSSFDDARHRVDPKRLMPSSVGATP